MRGSVRALAAPERKGKTKEKKIIGVLRIELRT